MLKLVWGEKVAYLLTKNDKNVISGSGFVKNAVFYKDMLAFYDAYNNLMQQSTSSLPSFCFKNGKYSLEGICLLFKDYASELGFESVRLSLDYLKVLYYTIASYSTADTLVEKQVLISEFEVYKKASLDLAISASAELRKAKDEYQKEKDAFDQTTSKYAKSLVSSNILGGLFTVLMIVGIIAGMLPFTCYYMGKFSWDTATWICVGVVSVFIVAEIVIKIFSKKLFEKANDFKYEIQGKKKRKDGVELELNAVINKYNKINAEKYEYNSNFSAELKNYAKTISFKEVLERASEYKFLSYNMKNDILNLFETQSEDIKNCIDRINAITAPETSDAEFEKLYGEILQKDWLYFNNEVRFEFIKRMADVSEFSFNYCVKYDSKKIDPFGISVKSLSKEPIVYLRSEEDLFVSSTLDKFLNTKFIKNSKTLELKGLRGSDALKRAKMEFATHFFDYEGTKRYNNLFYATKLHDGVKIPTDILEKNRKVPTFVYMKLKLIESRLSLGNSDTQTIKQLAKLILSYEETGSFDQIAGISMQEDPQEQEVQVEDCTYEDLGYAVRYTFEDGSFIGYRLTNVVN